MLKWFYKISPIYCTEYLGRNYFADHGKILLPIGIKRVYLLGTYRLVPRNCAAFVLRIDENYQGFYWPQEQMEFRGGGEWVAPILLGDGGPGQYHVKLVNMPRTLDILYRYWRYNAKHKGESASLPAELVYPMMNVVGNVDLVIE